MNSPPRPMSIILQNKKMSDPNNNGTTTNEEASDAPEETLDFTGGKTFNMHFCPKAINGSHDCDFIYCGRCYDEVKPRGKRIRKNTAKAKKPMEADTSAAATNNGGCGDHQKTLFNACDNGDRNYFLPSYLQGKSIPTHCKGCNKRIVVA